MNKMNRLYRSSSSSSVSSSSEDEAPAPPARAEPRKSRTGTRALGTLFWRVSIRAACAEEQAPTFWIRKVDQSESLLSASPNVLKQVLCNRQGAADHPDK